MPDNRTKAVQTLDWALENTGMNMNSFARYLINDYLNSDMALDAINSYLQEEEGLDLDEVAVTYEWDKEIDPDDDSFFDDND